MMFAIVASSCGGDSGPVHNTIEAREPESVSDEGILAATDEIIGLDDLKLKINAVLGANGFGRRPLAGTESACVVTRLQQEDDAGLVETLAALKDDLIEVAGPELDTVAELMLTVAPCSPERTGERFLETLGPLGEETLAPDLGTCLAGELGEENPDRFDAATGLLAFRVEVVPVETMEPMADALVTCLPGEQFSTTLAERGGEVLFDSTCLSSAYSDSGLRAMWLEMAERADVTVPNFDQILGAPMRSCISLGSEIASNVSAQGTSLTHEEIQCMDAIVAESNLWELLAGRASRLKKAATEVTNYCIGFESE